MSSVPQHGRRRAEPARKPSRRETIQHEAALAKTGGPARRMAVVAVAAALLAGGGLAQAATSNTSGGLATASLVSGTQASASPSAVSAPKDIAVSFSRIDVSSAAKSKTAAKAKVQAKAGSVTAESDSVTPVATPTKAAAPVLVDDPAGAQAYAASQLAAKGWGQDQMGCLNRLWTQESSWLTSAENASSGAYGIAQSLPAEKMAIAGPDYRTNYRTQIRWGLTYIEARYGTPCGAWNQEVAVGWY